MTSSDEWSVWRSSGRSLDVSLDEDRREMEAFRPLGSPTGEKNGSGSMESQGETCRSGAEGQHTTGTGDLERLVPGRGRK